MARKYERKRASRSLGPKPSLFLNHVFCVWNIFLSECFFREGFRKHHQVRKKERIYKKSEIKEREKGNKKSALVLLLMVSFSPVSFSLIIPLSPYSLLKSHPFLSFYLFLKHIRKAVAFCNERSFPPFALCYIRTRSFLSRSSNNFFFSRKEV